MAKPLASLASATPKIALPTLAQITSSDYTAKESHTSSAKRKLFQTPAGAKESTWQIDSFDDKEFYEGIDLDALVEQATKELIEINYRVCNKSHDIKLDDKKI
ncbi:hypothetical protein Tco_0375589 [Tanacetum coccineum]